MIAGPAAAQRRSAERLSSWFRAEPAIEVLDIGRKAAQRRVIACAQLEIFAHAFEIFAREFEVMGGARKGFFRVVDRLPDDVVNSVHCGCSLVDEPTERRKAGAAYVRA
jgi:hypothetical protein